MKTVIDRIEESLPADVFFKRFIVANRPCLISAHLTASWEARSLWVKSGKPDIDYLVQKYGKLMAPVVNCEQRHYNAQTRMEMTFTKYAEYWERRSYEESNPACLYLKDWHLQRETTDKFYDVPEYFASDWLNEYLDEKHEDDYKFTYIGVKGSWTPFHADVFGSFSWSSNVCGRKLWYLVPKGEELRLRDNKGQLPYDLRLIQDERMSLWTELVQEQGETVFIPSGWHHQVINLEDTISINHNWFNGANIFLVLDTLLRANQSVADELKDCEPPQTDLKATAEWEDQCQLVLKCHHGMNFEDFTDLISTITDKRLRSDSSSEFLIKFDMEKLIEMLKTLKSCRLFMSVWKRKNLDELLNRLEARFQSL